jgi:hypothetical protein
VRNNEEMGMETDAETHAPTPRRSSAEVLGAVLEKLRREHPEFYEATLRRMGRRSIIDNPERSRSEEDRDKRSREG